MIFKNLHSPVRIIAKGALNSKMSFNTLDFTHITKLKSPNIIRNCYDMPDTLDLPISIILSRSFFKISADGILT